MIICYCDYLKSKEDETALYYQASRILVTRCLHLLPHQRGGGVRGPAKSRTARQVRVRDGAARTGPGQGRRLLRAAAARGHPQHPLLPQCPKLCYFSNVTT